MADYKELLRRAVEALPENNGAARRAVYEKARAALVGQLRAINPPLAARDITAHRLQLEDCIRQVEQEASEAVIAGLGSSREESPPPPPVYFEPPAKKAPAAVAKPVAKPPLAAAPTKEPPKPLPQGASIEEIIAAANAEHVDPAPDQTRSVSRPDAKAAGKPVPKLVPSPAARPAEPKVAAKRPEPPKPEPEYIEIAEDEPEAEIEEEEIAVAPRAVPERAPQPAMRAPTKPVPPTAPTGRPLPSIVARAEAAKSRGTSGPVVAPPIDGARRGPAIEPRRDVAAARIESGPRSGPAFQPRPVAQSQADYDEDVLTAMSSVREVDVEAEPVSLDPQGAIDRAIATLDREARADAEADGPNGRDIEAALSAPLDEKSVLKKPARKRVELDEDDEPEPRARRSDAPKVGRGGREDKAAKPAKATAFAPTAKVRPQGKRNLALEADSGFPRARQERSGLSAVTIFLVVFAVLLVGAGGAGFWAWREGYINLDQMFGRGAVTETAAAATAAPAKTASADAPATGPGNTAAPAEPTQSNVELKQEERLAADPSVAASQTVALPLQDPSKTDARLASTDGSPAANAAAAAAIDPAAAAGSQSLLLEAQANGTTGAVPYSGTVEWSKGKDEMGLPTLIAKANIPARNLAVDVLIRKNSDPSLPASHLMEVNFRVNDSFVGGSIAGLPGVLLKNEELVQGTPLVGASARVVGNSFLFALSARPEDIAANAKLLTDRKWMDLALIYATGQRAIITLEKDDQATSLFNEVVAEWGSKSTASQ